MPDCAAGSMASAKAESIADARPAVLLVGSEEETAVDLRAAGPVAEKAGNDHAAAPSTDIGMRSVAAAAAPAVPTPTADDGVGETATGLAGREEGSAPAGRPEDDDDDDDGELSAATDALSCSMAAAAATASGGGLASKETPQRGSSCVSNSAARENPRIRHAALLRGDRTSSVLQASAALAAFSRSRSQGPTGKEHARVRCSSTPAVLAAEPEGGAEGGRGAPAGEDTKSAASNDGRP
jgi:hypothetical protein